MGMNYASFIWSIADLLRGSFKAHQYGDIVLPFTVLRRLDAVLAPTKPRVLEAVAEARRRNIPVRAGLLRQQAGHEYSFFNASRFDLRTALGDPENLAENLLDCVAGFSENVRDIFQKYKIEGRIGELTDANLLFYVTQHFAEVDLSPAAVSNEEMGHIFEELIRKFAEASNETAGEHFTPRDVIELMVDVLLTPDSDALVKPNVVRSIYDPTAGTGGMLSVAEDHIRQMNPTATLTLAGQEINPQSYAICKADMTVKGQSVNAIVFGDALLDDGHKGSTFNYCLSNPPFGVDWKKQQKAVTEEHTLRGYAGRFGPGLPRVSDGSMLFLLHLISKMRPAVDGGNGGRAGIVLNGSPLFTGGAGSGESNIRKWVLERNLLEAIIASMDVFWDRWRAAVDSGDDLEKGRLEEFRGTVGAFVRTYDFLSQIIDYGDTRVEKWAIFLRVYRRTIERDTDDGMAVVTDDIVLTHYRLRRQEQRDLKLGDGEPGELKGITEAGSGQPREPKYGPLQAVIDQINQLFIGTGVDEIDQVGAVEAVTRHLVDNHRLQSEAMANTRADFSTSPTIELELEDVVYAAAAGNSGAFKALLQLDSLRPLVPILLKAGIYEKLRDEAERVAS